LEVIWADGFPFVFFFVPAVIHFFKKRWFEEKRFFYSFAFISVYILFFSISSGKRSVYILPIYPMIAIFLSFAIEQWHIKEFPKKWLISVSLLIAVIPLTTIPFLLKRVNFTLSFEVTLLIFALISYSLGCLTFIYIFVKRELFLPQIFAIFSLLLLFSAIPSVISIDKIKVPYDFVSSAKPLTKCGVKVGVYPSLIPSVNFYLESNTVVFKKLEEEKAIDFVIKGNLLLSKENETPENIRMISTVLWKGQIGDDNYILLASY
ncbi:MAG: hypothetical protein N2445_05740, partial [Acidobacteria bacterium]|nr:hypothetical protein [Acidobacteriota bacterium]